MLQVKSKHNGGYSASIAAQYVDSDLEFINVTIKPEEVQVYDKANHQFLEKLDHVNIYVCQNVGDFLQNPFKVKITGYVPNNLKFGQRVKLKDLVACRVKNNGYSQVYFKAESVQVLKEENK